MSRPPLAERLAAALPAAMRARDSVAVSALRSAVAALGNAEAVPVDAAPPAGALEHARVGAGAADVPRRELDEAEVHAVVRAEVTSRDEAADRLAGHGRHEQADRLRAEAQVLRGHLED